MPLPTDELPDILEGLASRSLDDPEDRAAVEAELRALVQPLQDALLAWGYWANQPAWGGPDLDRATGATPAWAFLACHNQPPSTT